jgi:hypothetical protein
MPRHAIVFWLLAAAPIMPGQVTAVSSADFRPGIPSPGSLVTLSARIWAFVNQ